MAYINEPAQTVAYSFKGRGLPGSSRGLQDVSHGLPFARTRPYIVSQNAKSTDPGLSSWLTNCFGQ